MLRLRAFTLILLCVLAGASLGAQAPVTNGWSSFGVLPFRGYDFIVVQTPTRYILYYMQRGDPSQPEGSTNSPYLEILENNTHVIYPALAILVVVLIVAGILHAWKTDDLDSVVKAEAKREIVMQLRREMHGMSAERLTRMTGLDLMKLIRLLQEMQEDGMLTSHTNSQRQTTWVLKGIGGT